MTTSRARTVMPSLNKVFKAQNLSARAGRGAGNDGGITEEGEGTLMTETHTHGKYAHEWRKKEKSVCVCVCVRGRERDIGGLCLCLYVGGGERECVCVCVSERERENSSHLFHLGERRQSNSSSNRLQGWYSQNYSRPSYNRYLY
jgi:hypothetical protein